MKIYMPSGNPWFRVSFVFDVSKTHFDFSRAALLPKSFCPRSKKVGRRRFIDILDGKNPKLSMMTAPFE
jgi:hypothetical protein